MRRIAVLEVQVAEAQEGVRLAKWWWPRVCEYAEGQRRMKDKAVALLWEARRELEELKARLERNEA